MLRYYVIRNPVRRVLTFGGSRPVQNSAILTQHIHFRRRFGRICDAGFFTCIRKDEYKQLVALRKAGSLSYDKCKHLVCNAWGYGGGNW